MIGIVFHLREDGSLIGEYNFVEVSTTQGALLPLADDSHLGGADVTDGVVTHSYTEHLHAVQTKLARGGGGGGHVDVVLAEDGECSTES